jgi:hypothetical protein
VTDQRLLFFGDSLVAGVGDPTGAGWVGRVVAASFTSGLGLTAYNLGIRGETSEQIASRWRVEALLDRVAGLLREVVRNGPERDASHRYPDGSCILSIELNSQLGHYE